MAFSWLVPNISAFIFFILAGTLLIWPGCSASRVSPFLPWAVSQSANAPFEFSKWKLKWMIFFYSSFLCIWSYSGILWAVTRSLQKTFFHCVQLNSPWCVSWEETTIESSGSTEAVWHLMVKRRQTILLYASLLLHWPKHGGFGFIFSTGKRYLPPRQQWIKTKVETASRLTLLIWTATEGHTGEHLP